MDYIFIKKFLFSPFLGGFVYFTPLVVLSKKPPAFYKILFKLIVALGFLHLLLSIISIDILLDANNIKARDTFEIYVKVLAIPSGYILMTANYHKITKKTIAFLTLGTTLLLSIYLARRGLMFISGCTFIFSYYLYILRKKKQILTIIFTGLMSFTFLGLGLISFGNINNSKFFEKAKERIGEDTRTGVEEYYYADMEFKDYVIGRGMSGLIAAPGEIDGETDHPGYREGIETDYLNIILKGGVISLGLLLLIAIPAMINCFFFSNNSLSKAAGFWILLWLISLYPSTVTNFTLHYILVWISIGIGYSKATREIPDKILQEYFIKYSL
ncbi:hypothetical protein [uncultured Maribacter sp.]|uniref:hypothetical protein n=1 Tax=uncultured Maribacter sp. TaxID=431308 RepID=UPI00261F2A43|nr:hypothetical protein [uncultured Maribacter sp.]